MANAAKTVEARQQWNDLAAELRHKADLQDGLIAVTTLAAPEPKEVPASSATDPDVPSQGEPSRSPSDLGSKSEATPSEPATAEEAAPEPTHIVEDISANEEKILPTDHQAIQTNHAFPEVVETADPDWEALIANIRSTKRPNEQD
jgi:hypothetical protein